MQPYTLTEEPSGNTYRSLLLFLLGSQHSFSLVWREQLTFEPAALSLQHDLQSLELSRATTDSWPGTKLLGSHALVVTYRCSPLAMGPLVVPGSLFAWLAPRWPEDLAFYSAPGHCSFASISHERDAWIAETVLAERVADFIALNPSPRPQRVH